MNGTYPKVLIAGAGPVGMACDLRFFRDDRSKLYLRKRAEPLVGLDVNPPALSKNDRSCHDRP
jgi:hypothetical protein